MHIRTATIQDLDTLVDFGKRLTSESPNFNDQGFDEDRAADFFTRLIQLQESILLVSNDDGEDIGALIGAIDMCWRTGHRLAFENGVYVLPEYRKSGAASELLNTFIEWAKINNADRIQLGTMSGIHANKTIQLYESLGFKLIGHVVEMEVSHV